MGSKRVILDLEERDLKLLLTGLNRVWGDRNDAVEKLKHSKELARGKAYEDEIDEAIADYRRELSDISNLYARMSSFGG